MSILCNCRTKAVFFALTFFLFACSKPAKKPQTIKIFTLNQGDTLGESLKETGLGNQYCAQIITNLAGIMPMNRCKPGDKYEINFSSPEGFASFKYFTAGLDYYSVQNASGAVTAEKKTKNADKIISEAKGAIKTSLWESMSAQNINPELIVNFADIFAWQIDFLTEPRIGDTYKIIYEKYVADDGLTKYGEILAAQYNASGQVYTALLYTDSKNHKDYYSPDGKSLESAFLRAPLQFRRISSYFSLRRFHPILKYFRPHLGIDYAAPSGTPVSAIGEGAVTFAGARGGFGNFVELRHANGYCSYYGHLLRFGKSVRRGLHVRQGQIIGYVGASGLATGPHLDFRMAKNGTFINFLRLKIPSANKISDNEKEAFKTFKREIFTKLAQIR
jgi:murein DD-endopeptidase MepM/ murein hydrolase activator NlpD